MSALSEKDSVRHIDSFQWFNGLSPTLPFPSGLVSKELRVVTGLDSFKNSTHDEIKVQLLIFSGYKYFNYMFN